MPIQNYTLALRDKDRANLGDHLGCRDPEHIRAFSQVGIKARRGHPRQCVSTSKKTGERCRLIAVKGSCDCHMHISRDEYIRLDQTRRISCEAAAQTAVWQMARDRAQRSIAAMNRRELMFTWSKVDPNFPGSTIIFQHESHKSRCVSWLKEIGFALDEPSPVSGEALTYRCIDRCLHAAAKYLIKLNVSEEQSLGKIRNAHKADARYYRMLKEADEELSVQTP